MNKGVHLVMEGIGLKEAILNFSSEDGRVYFIVPWYGRTLVGTTDTYYNEGVDEILAADVDIDYLLKSANAILPRIDWSRDDIIQSFAGVRFLRAADENDPSAVSREWEVIDVASGVFASVGGKLTSARADAELMVDRVIEHLGDGLNSDDLGQKFYDCIDDWEEFQDVNQRRLAEHAIDLECARWLVRRFPNEMDEIVSLLVGRPQLAQRIVAGLPFAQVELVLAVRHEMVCHLDDLLRRRIPLAILTRLDRCSLEEIVGMLRDELHWDEARVRSEVDSLLKKYGG